MKLNSTYALQLAALVACVYFCCSKMTNDYLAITVTKMPLRHH